MQLEYDDITAASNVAAQVLAPPIAKACSQELLLQEHSHCNHPPGVVL